MSKDLITPDLGNLTAAAVYDQDGGLDKVITDIREACAGVVFNMETKKGQAECRSVAFKITRSRTFLDDLGKEHTADLRKRLKTVDSQRREMREDLEALRDEVRKPLTELEEAEKELAAAIQKRIDSLKISIWPFEVSAITERLQELGAIELLAVDYGARLAEAKAVLKDEISTGEKALEHAKHRDAESQRLAEEAAAAQAKREAEIEERAREAERKRVEAAQAEIVERAKREERERIEAEHQETLNRKADELEQQMFAAKLAEAQKVQLERDIEAARQQVEQKPVVLDEQEFTEDEAVKQYEKLITPVDNSVKINAAMESTVDALVADFGEDHRVMFQDLVRNVADGQYFNLRLDV